MFCGKYYTQLTIKDTLQYSLALIMVNEISKVIGHHSAEGGIKRFYSTNVLKCLRWLEKVVLNSCSILISNLVIILNSC